MIKKESAKIICNEFQIAEGTFIALVDNHIIDPEGARNFLIKKEYKTLINSQPLNEAKYILSEKYCVSFSLVEKVVNNRL